MHMQCYYHMYNYLFPTLHFNKTQIRSYPSHFNSTQMIRGYGGPKPVGLVTIKGIKIVILLISYFTVAALLGYQLPIYSFFNS